MQGDYWHTVVQRVWRSVPFHDLSNIYRVPLFSSETALYHISFGQLFLNIIILLPVIMLTQVCYTFLDMY